MRIFKLAGVLLAVIALMAVGSVACGDDDGDDAALEGALGDVLKNSFIKSGDFEKIEEGMTRADAEKIIPPLVEDLEIGGAGDEPAGAVCAYYFDKDDPTTAYRICYENDSVVDKVEFTAETEPSP